MDTKGVEPNVHTEIIQILVSLGPSEVNFMICEVSIRRGSIIIFFKKILLSLVVVFVYYFTLLAKVKCAYEPSMKLLG